MLAVCSVGIELYWGKVRVTFFFCCCCCCCVAVIRFCFVFVLGWFVFLCPVFVLVR